LAGAEVDPIVLEVLERSCQNCHSEKTEWSWYSHIAPMSWLVESDVSQARGHMNLSRWDGYTPEQKQDLLGRMGSIVRSGQMPPGRYTLVHPNSKLSDNDREQTYVWAHTERRRVKSATSGGQ
jgi:Haem-binding domain